MFYVKNVGGFNLFMPSENIIPAFSEQTQRRKLMNEQFLKESVRSRQPALKVTGSYVCPHAPDYVGEPTLDWDEPRWRELFREMRCCGMDTAFFQASIWNELGECYYNSEYFKNEYRIWSVVEPMLTAAGREGMRIFLGGYGSVVGWLESHDEQVVKRELERQLICMKELLGLGLEFAGIYFSPETAFHGVREPEKEKALNYLYREYFGRIREIAPEKKLAVSPASMYYPGMESRFREFWAAMLDGVPLDILMPQDSIGSGCCSLSEQPEMWRLWREVADAHRIRLWCHMELFERREFGGTTPFRAAAPERVAMQLNNLAPYVEKCICFEFPYFAGKAEGGAQLKSRIFGQ